MSDMTPQEAADYLDNSDRAVGFTAAWHHALQVLIDHARAAAPEGTAMGALLRPIDRAPGMGCPANEGGEHSPGTGRSWRECNDCDVWPYAEPPRRDDDPTPTVAAPPREDEGNDREGEAHPFDAEWPDHDEPAITPAAPPAEGEAASERPDRTARSLSLAGDFPNDGRINVFLRVGHLTERILGTVDRDELRWDVGPTMAAFLRAAADAFENGAPLEPGADPDGHAALPEPCPIHFPRGWNGVDADEQASVAAGMSSIGPMLGAECSHGVWWRTDRLTKPGETS